MQLPYGIGLQPNWPNTTRLNYRSCSNKTTINWSATCGCDSILSGGSIMKDSQASQRILCVCVWRWAGPENSLNWSLTLFLPPLFSLKFAGSSVMSPRCSYRLWTLLWTIMLFWWRRKKHPILCAEDLSKEVSSIVFLYSGIVLKFKIQKLKSKSFVNK